MSLDEKELNKVKLLIQDEITGDNFYSVCRIRYGYSQ